MSRTIVETAREPGWFTTLPVAVDAAGLQDPRPPRNGLVHVIDRVLPPAAR